MQFTVINIFHGINKYEEFATSIVKHLETNIGAIHLLQLHVMTSWFAFNSKKTHQNDLKYQYVNLYTFIPSNNGTSYTYQIYLLFPAL